MALPVTMNGTIDPTGRFPAGFRSIQRFTTIWFALHNPADLFGLTGLG